MKKIMNAVFGVMLFSATVVPSKAQNLEVSLNEAYHDLQSATGIPALMEARSKFNMIASKWPKEWAANYYAAYANAYISDKESDVKRKDQLLDQADGYVTKMNAMNVIKDESHVLTAYVAFSRFLVDPANRWKKYLDIMNANLEKAKKLNPDNPRIYYLQGVPIFNKPVLYGGGKGKAKPYFEKAKPLFTKQNKSFILNPYWGEKENADYLLKCDK